jgi:hypothetical protein
MVINDITTSDCEIVNTTIKENCIRILFHKVYNLRMECYVENVSVIIKDWETLKIKMADIGWKIFLKNVLLK